MHKRCVLGPTVVQQQLLDALVCAEEQGRRGHAADGCRCQTIVDAAKAARSPETTFALQSRFHRVDGKEDDVHDQTGNSARLFFVVVTRVCVVCMC